jgi:cyclopropane fatty-acyl-phospholipid synthase-like methyltransferase
MLNDYAEDYSQNFSFFKDYTKEARFLDQVLARHGTQVQRLLDIACGPGSHIVNLAAMGYECDAADIDPDMLLLTEQAAADRTVSIRTHTADMRQFQLQGNFDAALNMFYAFQNVLFDDMEQTAFFRGVSDLLAAPGLFVIDLLPEENNLHLFPPGTHFPVHHSEQDNGTTLTVTSTNRVLSDKVKEIVFHYATTQQDGTSETREIVSPIRRVYLEQFHELLANTGFTLVGQYGDFDIDHPFDAESSKLIAVLQKA